MAVNTRVIRGDRWGARLGLMLATPPADTVQWMRQHTQLLKSDSNSLVGLLQVEREPCCLKLYRHKSIAQRCWFALGRGRPVHSFEVAGELLARGVRVPRPRACLLVPGGMLLLCEEIPGGGDLNALWRQQPAREEARRLLQSAGETLAQLHRAGYAHGDCKWSNLLWSDGRCYLVDLDGVRRAAAGGKRQARDLARFTLDAEELDAGPELYEVFLASYLRGVGGSRRATLERMMPGLHRLRARHLAKYGARGQRLF